MRNTVLVVALAFWAGNPPVLADDCQLSEVLSEGWDDVNQLPSTDWLQVCDAPVCSSINTEVGNPAPSLNVGGTVGGVGTTSWTYNGSYLANYLDGWSMQADVWLAGDGCHFTDVTIGLWQEPQPMIDDEGPGWAVFMWFNKGCVENQIAMGIYSTDPDHDEVFSFFGPNAYAPEAWNTGRIVVRKDQRVEFYVKTPDDEGFDLLWTTTKTIDPSYSGQAPLVIVGKEGGGPARLDNILVDECDPCDAINHLTVRCANEKLQAQIVTDASPGTQYRLIADDAFYRDKSVGTNGKALVTWPGPVSGVHEVCVDGCDVCETVECP